jgi:dynein heavy chain
MSPLMENIAKALVKRVRDEVKLSDVFKMDFIDARRLVQEAANVLNKWNSEYFSVRKKIEDSGSDHRWEFDSNSNYIYILFYYTVS